MIVYLDQNIASRLATAAPGSEWSEIRTRLITGFEEERIICPLPTETLIESAACGREKRIAIDEFFYSVSGGVTFRALNEILVDETLALIRADHVFSPFGTIEPGWGARDLAAYNAKTIVTESKVTMRERIKDHSYSPTAATMSVDRIFESVGTERCGKFWRDLHTFAATPEAPLSEYEEPWLISALGKHAITASEALELSEAVQNRKWEPILVNFFDMLLGSRWDHDIVRGNKPNYDPNDDFDRWRAAVALSYADVFITDGYVEELCKKAKVEKWTSTRVFSIRTPDAILAFFTASTDGQE